MRKVVLGIALVLCLDVAFIWMISNESEGTEIARAIAPAVMAPVMREQPQSIPEPIEDSVEPIIERSPSAPDLRPKRRETPDQRAGSQSQEPDISDRPLPGEIKNLYPDRIIFIGKTEVSVATADREPVPVRDEVEPRSDLQASTRTEREIKKRSFPSKAFSIVKKPYEWVKALAAKIN